MASPASPRSDRRTLLRSALALAFGSVVVLGVLALAVATYFRTTAETMIQDHTGLAGDRLAELLGSGLAQGIAPLIGAARPGNRDRGVTATPRSIAASRPPDDILASSIESVFRVTPPPRAVLSSGQPLSAEAEAVLLGLADQGPRELPRSAYFGIAWPRAAPGSVMVYYPTRDSSGTGTGIFGVVVPLDSVRRLLQTIAGDRSLLPRRMATRVASDSAVGFAVRIPLGDLVSHRFDPTSPYQATNDLGAMFGHLTAVVSLDPNVAARLVAGGVPRYRAQALGGVLGLAVASLILLGLVVRREHRLQDLREAFVAGVSHELRTPLAQLRLFSETLALNRVRSEEERIRSLEIIGKETERLSHLVENLLLFSRLERESVTLAPQQTDLGELVGRVLDEFAPLLGPGTRLARRLEPEVRASVDPGAVRQICLNLLDNAVKYGPPGQNIAVSLETAADRARLLVTDEGPGIPTEDRALVWQRFWRGSIAKERGIGGTGIGLAIVDDLVRAHGGTAAITTAEAGGAQFIVTLPLARRA